MPDWVKHAIWWQVYPLGFASAEAANEPAGDGAPPVTHRLGQLSGWLDYAVDLGASGIALGPIFPAQTHGYDTTDDYLIDPRLGDERDFAELAGAAHARGLRVLLAGVMNHWLDAGADGGWTPPTPCPRRSGPGCCPRSGRGIPGPGR